MEISGKLILFVQDKKGKENIPFKTFSTTISSKQLDGEYLNKSMEVRFNTENIPQEALNQLQSSKYYTLDVEEGWHGVRAYKNDNDEEIRVLYIYVNKATVKEAKLIQSSSKNNDFPF